MDRAFDLLPGVLRKRGLQEHAMGALAVHAAMQWIMQELPAVSAVVHVQSVKDGEMLIACDHAAAMQECHMRLAQLLAFLRTACPSQPIAHIRLVRS